MLIGLIAVLATLGFSRLTGAGTVARRCVEECRIRHRLRDSGANDKNVSGHDNDLRSLVHSRT